MHAPEPDDADVRPVRIPLSVNDPNAPRSLTRSVERLVSRGHGAVPVIVELHGSHLPAPLIAALIGNLRRVREVGGGLAVRAGTPGLRSALALHGLDRVLAEPSSTAGSATRLRHPNAGSAWPILALLLLTVTIGTVAVVLQFSPG